MSRVPWPALPCPFQPRALELVALWGDTVLDAHTLYPGERKSFDGWPTAHHLGSTAQIGDVELQSGDEHRFELLNLTLVARFTDGEVELGVGRPNDYSFARIFTICMLAHFFFVIAAHNTRRTERRLPNPLFSETKHLSGIFVEPPPPKEPPVGNVKPPPLPGKRGHSLGQKSNRTKLRTSRSAREVALNSGILGIFNKANGGALSQVMSSDIGGLRGRMSAFGTPSAGLGSPDGLGSSRGGDGTGGGGYPIDIGTPGGGRPDVKINNDGWKRKKPVVPPRQPKTVGNGLSRDEIAKVIRRNLPRYRFCYEKELTRHVNLQGKLLVNFTIAPHGRVARAKVLEDGLDSTTVRDCVLDVTKSLVFPKVRGGGMVVVNYPFIFRAS